MADNTRSIFSSSTGAVSVYTVEDSQDLARIEFTDFKEHISSTNLALVSGVSYTQATNHQFMSSLRDAVYVYVFGDQMGDINVTGFLFLQECDDGSNGFTEVLRFYEEKRLAKSGAPVKVVIGDDVITGFLTRLSIQPTDPQRYTTPFTMLINSLPKKREGASSSGPAAAAGAPGSESPADNAVYAENFTNSLSAGTVG